MGEPIIIWPPNCGNFAPGDQPGACTDTGYTDCTDMAAEFDAYYETGSGYQNAVSEGYTLCC